VTDEKTPPAHGTKVFYRGRFYDFGYVGATGMWILYEEGCRNMQDSIAVDPMNVQRDAEAAARLRTSKVERGG
jgi:hypothetical protein